LEGFFQKEKAQGSLSLFASVMDLKGQQLAEWLMTYLLIAFAAAGWLLGFATQSFQVTVIVVALGVTCICLLLVPDWPYFNRHPIKFRTPKADSAAVASAPVLAPVAAADAKSKKSN
jgi:signal peptidase complex subunit 1